MSNSKLPVAINLLCEGSIVRTNLLTVPGYSPYCGDARCQYRMPRAQWDANQQQFTCKCGWMSDFPRAFVNAYVNYRIESQVCERCGVTCGENKQKYCGDGNDKDIAHQWRRPVYR